MSVARSIFVFCSVALITGCSREREEYFNGRAFATQDVRSNILHVAFGDPGQIPSPPWTANYVGLLQTNYGIQPVWFSLPSDSRAVQAWVRGYNEVSQPEIERRFGTNALSRTLANAHKLYEEQHSKGPTNGLQRTVR